MQSEDGQRRQFFTPCITKSDSWSPWGLIWTGRGLREMVLIDPARARRARFMDAGDGRVGDKGDRGDAARLQVAGCLSPETSGDSEKVDKAGDTGMVKLREWAYRSGVERLFVIVGEGGTGRDCLLAGTGV